MPKNRKIETINKLSAIDTILNIVFRPSNNSNGTTNIYRENVYVTKIFCYWRKKVMYVHLIFSLPPIIIGTINASTSKCPLDIGMIWVKWPTESKNSASMKIINVFEIRATITIYSIIKFHAITNATNSPLQT